MGPRWAKGHQEHAVVQEVESCWVVKLVNIPHHRDGECECHIIRGVEIGKTEIMSG